MEQASKPLPGGRVSASGPEPMPDPTRQQMQEDWDQRAREDAHYFVAFGRRQQSMEEFLATAQEQARGFELELKRLPPAAPGSRRALEIGCGPGRLMHPLSRHFGEIHGVDISAEMIRLARLNLASIPHAHPHHAPNSDLAAFADDSFDFVYSYAVFQHIPSRDVVLQYLRDAARVLKPEGILRCQINGLPEAAKQYDTWSGVRIPAAEVKQFAREQGLLLLALEGVETQYMWATCRKPSASSSEARPTRIRRITNAHSSEPVAPSRGRFASISIWVEGLPGQADLNSLSVTIGGAPAVLTYLGHPETDSLQQLNALLPDALPTGLKPVGLFFQEDEICARSMVRLIPPGPPVPRIVSVSDGIDLLSGTRITTRSVKIAVEEVLEPDRLRAWVNGIDAPELEHFRTDPRVPRHEISLRLPDVIPDGPADIRLALGSRILGTMRVEVV